MPKSTMGCCAVTQEALPGKEVLFLLSGSGSVTRDEGGSTYAMWAIIRDISERKQIPESLHLSEERYRGIVESRTEFVDVTTLNQLLARISPETNQNPDDR